MSTSKSPGILLLGNYPPPYGGVPRHLEYLAPALASAGFDVHVLSSGGGGGRGGVQRREGVTIHKVGPWRRALCILRYPRRNYRAWRRHLASLSPWKPGDLKFLFMYLGFASLGRRLVARGGMAAIMAYNLMSYGPVGDLLSRECGVPLLVSNFGEYFSHPHFFSRHGEIARSSCLQARLRLSMTQHCARVYEQLDIRLPVEVVYYGTDVGAFRPGLEAYDLARRLGIGPGDEVVLYLGRFSREMGLEVFMEAAEILLERRSAAKVLIGGKPEELSGAAAAFAARHPQRVILYPDVPLEALPLFYSLATVVAVPTLGERACGSLSAAEAGACGKPVVASRVGGIPEFVRDGETGILVPPGDGPALAEALAKVCGDPSLAGRLGREACTFVRTRFNKDVTNRQIIGLLRRTLDGKDE